MDKEAQDDWTAAEELTRLKEALGETLELVKELKKELEELLG